MNILLIGNGFDLEHSLPTSYQDFLDFCVNVRKIYTYDENTTADSYWKNDLMGWKIDGSIKKVLLAAFDSRCFNKEIIEDLFYDTGVRTNNKELNELYSYIKFNSWLEYFLEQSSYIGENWIDFESEIARVVKALNAAKFQISCGGSYQNVDASEGNLLLTILKAAKGSSSAYKDLAAIERFANFLNAELEKLIRALEIYICGFVGKMPVIRRSVDIENLNPDHVLSFNYSDTYERVYGKDKIVKYDYIHGKAGIGKNVESCNLVLGINEFQNESDEEFIFLAFKKFYQRIYKSTDNDHLKWADEIKDGYTDYLKKQADVYERIKESVRDGSFNQHPYETNICRDLANTQCPQHTLYIFGHSLDVTDKDILKMFICNDNVQTKIFYYRKSEDDKTSLGKLIRNLLRIMDQKELIRRTGGLHKTIEFIPQTLHEEE